MKKPPHLFLGIALALLCFTCGFLIGRNSNRTLVTVSQPVQIQTATTTPNNSNGKVNINTATLQELTMLPGIGNSVAQKIIDYRTENGPFKTPEELINVKGIGSQKLEDIIKYITVGGGL